MDKFLLMDDVEFQWLKYHISTTEINSTIIIYETMVFPYDDMKEINWNRLIYGEACSEKSKALERHHYISAHINEFI